MVPGIRRVALGCCLLLATAGAARAQISAPGLGLDRPDLGEAFVFRSSPDLPGYLGWAIPGQFQSLGPASPGYSPSGTVLLAFQGGAAPVGVPLSGVLPVFPIPPRSPSSASYLNTLLPPFASGAWVLFGYPDALIVSAYLYEPDQVKRKQTAQGPRSLLKQKDYVALRVGSFSPSSYVLQPATTVLGPIQGCKASADVRGSSFGGPTPTVKMQVTCRGELGRNLKRFAKGAFGLPKLQIKGEVGPIP